MMKLFKSILLFLITSALPGLIFYALFEGVLLLIIAAVWCVVWSVIFLYIDKLLLLFMGAREVIDVNHQYLFQSFKSEGYKNSEKTPKVFLYNGHAKKCFVFESRGEWTVLLDRRLVREISQEEVTDLVSFVYELKRRGIPWYQTKAMGLCAITFKLVSFLLGKVLFLNSKGHLYRVLSIFLLTLMRPLISPIEYFAKKEKSVEAREGLRAIYYELSDYKMNESYNGYINSYLEYGQKESVILRKYLEGYPVIENSHFVSIQ